jgi:NAD(P)-dependent dehydrogenase (short-subunit alcohol dehydrogenase family)
MSSMGWFEDRSGLDGTVALITGGAGGLGRASVLDLVANGVRVAVIDIDADAVASLRSQLEREGVEAIIHHGDARDRESLENLFSAVEHRWPRLDTLVNCVGGTFTALFADTNPKGWDSLLRTNLVHVLHACSLAIPLMRAGGRGGSIINMSSIEASRAAPGYAVYSAAKAAVEQFARTLAVELAPDGIRVNNLAPDFTPTPNILKIAGDQLTMNDPLGARIAIPMARPGELADVSGCVVFLASDLSRYVTGMTLRPDGGTSASSGWFNWPDGGWLNFVPRTVLDRISAPEPT